MTTRFATQKLFPVLAMLGGLLLTQTLRADEAIETLVTFNGPNGAFPGSVTEGPHGELYGTTYSGGKYDKGTIFIVPLNKPLETLATFDGSNGANPAPTLREGPDHFYYGTTRSGGADGRGTIFKVSRDGKISTLISFHGSNGASPRSGLALGKKEDGNFYGTTFAGGSSGKGTLFSVTPAGKLTTLQSFTGSNGTNPGALFRGQDGCLYGTTYVGGAHQKGEIFKYDPDPQFTVIYSFDGKTGANPQSALAQLSDGDFYGTAYSGGSDNQGTVFKMNSKGEVTLVVSFNGNNGGHPNSGLIQWSDGYFYIERLWDNEQIKASTPQWSGVNFCGTTSTGGESGHGTVFQVTSAGTLNTLVNFTGVNGHRLGTIPNSLIPGDDGNLYGTTYTGGPDDKGTIFRLLLQLWPPPGAGESPTTGSSGIPPVISP
jgi:uncharacterized repeat protein (TIGR03803 family)